MLDILDLAVYNNYHRIQKLIDQNRGHYVANFRSTPELSIHLLKYNIDIFSATLEVQHSYLIDEYLFENDKRDFIKN